MSPEESSAEFYRRLGIDPATAVEGSGVASWVGDSDVEIRWESCKVVSRHEYAAALRAYQDPQPPQSTASAPDVMGDILHTLQDVMKRLDGLEYQVRSINLKAHF